MSIDATLTLREGRSAYFTANGLPQDGGYRDRWVVIKIGWVPVFAFPNTEGRKRVVPFHDLHHVLTGYGTSLLGEAEIGAWELGSDCTVSPIAVFLNSQVFGILLPIHSRRLFRAFMRGRRAKNLYGSFIEDECLSRSVADMRQVLDIDAPIGEITAQDRRAFYRWSAVAVALSWGQSIPILALGWWIFG